MAQVRIWIHAVWGTKNRNPTMSNKRKRIELFKHMKAYAKEKKIYLDFINGEPNHVHCLISMACDQNIAQIMALLKGESARWANKHQLFDCELEWAGGYYAASVSQSQIERVRNYIREQAKFVSTQCTISILTALSISRTTLLALNSIYFSTPTLHSCKYYY